MTGASVTRLLNEGETEISRDGFKGQIFRVAMLSSDNDESITVTSYGARSAHTDVAEVISGNVADGWGRASYIAVRKSVDTLFTLFISEQKTSPKVFLSITESKAEFGTNLPQVRAFMAPCGPVGSMN